MSFSSGRKRMEIDADDVFLRAEAMTGMIGGTLPRIGFDARGGRT
jgi:hypothetical protein